MSERKYSTPAGCLAFLSVICFVGFLVSLTPYGRKDSHGSIGFPLAILLWREYRRQKAEEKKP
jgi:hypothetical protein